jgi:tRNA A37 threonylcarbamoyladenosine modification protein TsaB
VTAFAVATARSFTGSASASRPEGRPFGRRAGRGHSTLAGCRARARRNGPSRCCRCPRGEVYAAVFAAGGEPLVAEGVITPAELAGALPSGLRLVVGEDAGLAAEALEARLPGRVRVLPPPFGSARAAAVGVLGALALARGEGVPAAQVAARYLRRAEAEVRRTGERFEAG